MIELMKSKGFGAFWARGNLSALEQACLSSFVDKGYSLTLYSYDVVSNPPPGVTISSAADIVPEEMVARIRYNGRPNLAHFSDLFRYELIKKADLIWIDSDILMLSDLRAPPYENIIVKEEQGGINGAILYISDEGLMDYVSEVMASKLNKDLRWGETGPEIILQAVRQKKIRLKLYEHNFFYPIEHYDIWKTLLPSQYDECKEKCSNAVTIHLFNNILMQMGYWKDIAPPKGSFLYEQLEKADLLRFFSGIYPEQVMAACVENFRFRQSGKALGFKTILREFIPSVGRTFHHYVK